MRPVVTRARAGAVAVWSGIGRERGVPALLGHDIAAHGAAFSTVHPLRFRQAPLLYAATAFACGIALRHAWRPASLLTVGCALLIGFGLLAVARAPRLTLPIVAVVWVVLGWACATMRPPLEPSTAVLGYADGLQRQVAGTVIATEQFHPVAARGEDPLHRDEARLDAEEENPATTVQAADLRLAAIEEVTPEVSTMVPVGGGVRLMLHGNPPLQCGDRVEVTARMHPPPQYRDPGVWQYPEYLAANGISATGTAMRVQVQRPGNAPLACRMEAARHWASGRLQHFAAWQRHLRLPSALRWTPTDAGLLNAMLFGDRTDLQHGLRVQFERTGSFHLFVVAGMHVGFVAGATFSLLTWLRVRRSVALLLAFGVTFGYALLTGFGDPVQRALWMTGAYMAAQLLSRNRSMLNALGLASVLLLVARPQTLFDSAFQMTVLVIVAIGGIAMPLLQRTCQPYLHACRHLASKRIDAQSPPRIGQFRTSLRFMADLLGAALGSWARYVPPAVAWLLLATLELSVLSLVTELVMALPMALYFHRVTIVALPANLLVVPALPVLLASAIATFIGSLLSPWIALVPALVTAGLLRWTGAVIGGFGHLHAADWRIGDPPPTAVTLAGALACLAVVALRQRSRRLAWGGVALVPLLMAVVVLPYPTRGHPGALEVTAIDVGQGDSLFLAGPHGETMLIDAGGQAGAENRAHATTFDTGESVVSPYLWSRGLRHVDVLVLTHAHMDHIGGMLAVLHNFQPRELWVSVDADSPALRTLLSEAGNLGVAVRHLHRGDHPSWDGSTLEVLAPEPDRQPGQEPGNDDSLVLRASYGHASVLLEGDAEHPSEDRMLASALLRPVTLLKVGHHGSLTSTGDDFLAALHPRAAVISCGRGNRFGHPRMPVLQRLQADRVQTARTDTMGLAQYLLHADGTYDVSLPGVGSRWNLQR